MSVSLIGVRPGYPKADFSLTSRKYIVQWLVLSTTYADGPAVAQACSGLPVAYSAYSIGNDSDAYALLRSWKADRLEENSLTWVVEATYTTPEPKDGNTGTGQGTHTDTAGDYTNPLTELPLVTTGIVTRDIPITRVYNVNTGAFNAPMNSACEVFNPPAMRKDTALEIVITRNEAISSAHPALGVTYANAVNSDSFWGFNVGIVQCQSIASEKQTKQLQGGSIFAYLRCSYRFLCRPEGWDVFVLDAGNYYCCTGGVDVSAGSGDCPPVGCGTGTGTGTGVDGSNYCSGADGIYYACGGSGTGASRGCPNCTKKMAFLDQQGHPRKGLLNGRGGQLCPDADPVYMRLRPYNYLPFSTLALPNSFAAVQ